MGGQAYRSNFVMSRQKYFVNVNNTHDDAWLLYDFIIEEFNNLVINQLSDKSTGCFKLFD